MNLLITFSLILITWSYTHGLLFVVCLHLILRHILPSLLKLSHYTPRRRLGVEEVQVLLILDLGTGWVLSVTPRPRFSPGERTPPPPVPIVQQAEWTPEPVWTQWLEEKSFRLCRGSNLDRPVVQPLARHYTDWASRLTTYSSPIWKSLLSFYLIFCMGVKLKSITPKRNIDLGCLKTWLWGD
jgi:hypothetical protein